MAILTAAIIRILEAVSICMIAYNATLKLFIIPNLWNKEKEVFEQKKKSKIIKEIMRYKKRSYKVRFFTAVFLMTATFLLSMQEREIEMLVTMISGIIILPKEFYWVDNI